ncbi:hypothetical protein [Sinorhizobium meliloti]|nr:hypothetical protein [Sinorhizobium meliloti]
MSLVASDPLAELEELRALTAQLQAELYAKNLYMGLSGILCGGP